MRTWDDASEWQGPSCEGEEYSRRLGVQQGVFPGFGGGWKPRNAGNPGLYLGFGGCGIQNRYRVSRIGGITEFRY